MITEPGKPEKTRNLSRAVKSGAGPVSAIILAFFLFSYSSATHTPYAGLLMIVMVLISLSLGGAASGISTAVIAAVFDVFFFGRPQGVFDQDTPTVLRVALLQIISVFSIVLFGLVRRQGKQAKLVLEAQQIVAEYNQQLKDVFLHAPVSISITEGKSHKYVAANGTMRKIFGPVEMIGKTVREIYPDQRDGGQFFREFGEALGGKQIEHKEIKVLRDWDSAGAVTPRWFNLHRQPLRGPKGKVTGVLTFAVDVTDWVVSREKTAEHEKFLNELTNTLPALVWTTNATGKPDFYNRHWFDYTGLPPDAEFTRAVLEEDRSRVEALWQEALRKGNGFSAEYRLAGRGGSRWFLGESCAN